MRGPRICHSAKQRGYPAERCLVTDGGSTGALDRGRRELPAPLPAHRHIGQSHYGCHEVARYLGTSDKVRHCIRAIGENHQSLPHSDALCPGRPNGDEATMQNSGTPDTKMPASTELAGIEPQQIRTDASRGSASRPDRSRLSRRGSAIRFPAGN